MDLSSHNTDQVWLLIFVTFDLFLHELLPFAQISFSGLFFVIFRHIDMKFHIWICLDAIQVKFKFCRVLPSTFNRVSALCKKLVFRTFLSRLFDIDLKFGLWICFDIIQIKFDFYCVWPNCTPDIFFCLNLFFHTFLFRLSRYWHQI